MAADGEGPDLCAPGEARELLRAGLAHLNAGSVQELRAWFGLARERDDPHGSYWATRCLLERALQDLPVPVPVRRELADGALAALQGEPREPELLWRAAAVLRGVGAENGARALAESAAALDPRSDAARHVEGARNTRESLASHDLAGLDERALALSALARPREGMRLSLCMIVRDEEAMLPRCLESAVDAVDEVVVVDTGSRDRTREIARSYGADLIERPWRDSFSDARNASLDRATGDWVLYLDADEALVDGDAQRLRALLGRTWREGFHLLETSHMGEGSGTEAVTHAALRLFRNRPSHRFSGRVHEQIAASLPTWLPERFETTSIRIEHYGYLAAVRRERSKTARNLALLEREAAEQPPSPFLHHNLGAEHLAAGRPLAALAELERAWQLLDTEDARVRASFGPALCRRLVRTLAECGRGEDAERLAREGLESYPGYTDLVFELALAASARGEHELAEALCERCLAMGDAPSRYSPRVGCGTHLPRLQLAQLAHARGEPARAVELMREALGADASWASACAPVLQRLMATLLAEHEFEHFEALVPALSEACPDERERVELLASMYLEEGFPVAAAEEWMAICARAPDRRALLGLARVAERQGMAREAEELSAAAAAAHDSLSATKVPFPGAP